MLRKGSLVLLVAMTAMFCYPFQPPVVVSFQRLFTIGSIYGIAVGWFWVSSLLSSKLLRSATQVGVICLGSWWLFSVSQGTGEAWQRYATQLGGMAITQSVLFLCLRLPGWSWRSNPRRRRPPEQQSSPTAKASADSVGGGGRLSQSPFRIGSQFSILDVILLTTAYGVLMGLAIRYQPPIDASEYWSVVLGLWVLFPLLAAWTIRMILDVGHFRSWYWLLAVILLGVLVSFGLSCLQTQPLPSVLSQEEMDVPPELLQFWMLYGWVTLGFVISVAVFAIIGRVENWKSFPNGS